MAANAPADNTWMHVLGRHYGWFKVTFDGHRRCFGMHYFFHRPWRKHYVLSRVDRYPDRIPFALQFHVMERLQDQGFEYVRTPTARSDGALWVEADDRYWFVRRYTRHDENPNWSDPQLIDDAAKTLARMHEIGTTVPLDSLIEMEHIAPYHWTLERVLDNQELLEEGMWQTGRPHDQIGLVRQTLKELDLCRDDVSMVPVGITHQDYRPNNLLTRDGRVVEVIDWDLAQVDNQLYDAVVAAIHIAAHGLAHGSADLTRGTRFLDAYIESCAYSVSKEARQWMVRYTVARNLALSGTPGKWIPLQGLAVGESARAGV